MLHTHIWLIYQQCCIILVNDSVIKQNIHIHVYACVCTCTNTHTHKTRTVKTSGGKKIMPPIFFSEQSYNYNEIYIYHGYILYEVEIIFPQGLLLHYHQTFPTFAWDTLCQSQKTLWWRTLGPDIYVLFTALKMISPAPNWVNIYGILTIHTSQMSLNMCPIGALCNKYFCHHSLPSAYIHNICHFTLLQCQMQVSAWSIDNPGGAGQHCYLVDKTTTSTQRKIKKKKKNRGITFILTFVWYS